MNKDYYKILELEKGATPSEIKSSFRKLSMRHHPDKNGGSEESERKFKEITNCPVLINTSFNIRGEPIVNTPQDAFNCFMGTDLDILVIGDYYLEKDKQNENLKRDYTKQFELD